MDYGREIDIVYKKVPRCDRTIALWFPSRCRCSETISLFFSIFFVTKTGVVAWIRSAEILMNFFFFFFYVGSETFGRFIERNFISVIFYCYERSKFTNDLYLRTILIYDNRFFKKRQYLFILSLFLKINQIPYDCWTMITIKFLKIIFFDE